jgi:hypothetical protein
MQENWGKGGIFRACIETIGNKPQPHGSKGFTNFKKNYIRISKSEN